MRYTIQQEIWLRENYPLLGSVECGMKLGKTSRGILQKTSKMGLRMPSEIVHKLKQASYQRRWESLIQQSRKMIIDYTPELVYMLGFVWADGYIAKPGPWARQMHITMSQLDWESIKQFFPTTLGTIWTHTESKKCVRCQRRIYIRLSNPLFGIFLSDNGYETKSGDAPIKILNKIPKNMHWLFWLGVSDGDGCFYIGTIKQYQIASTYDQDWSSVEKAFKNIGIKKWYISRWKHKKRNSSNSKIVLSNKDALMRWINYLYPDKEKSNFGMKRKKDKAMQILGA